MSGLEDLEAVAAIIRRAVLQAVRDLADLALTEPEPEKPKPRKKAT